MVFLLEHFGKTYSSTSMYDHYTADHQGHAQWKSLNSPADFLDNKKGARGRLLSN